MASFSLCGHLLLSWPRPAWQTNIYVCTYEHITAFNIQRYSTSLPKFNQLYSDL